MHSGYIRDAFGMHSGCIWNPFGVHLGFFRFFLHFELADRFTIIRFAFGMYLGSVWILLVVRVW